MYLSKQPHSVSMTKIYGFVEVAESFLLCGVQLSVAITFSTSINLYPKNSSIKEQSVLMVIIAGIVFVGCIKS